MNEKQTKINSKSEEFNFESWMELWEDSPATFEYLRKKRIENYISSAPEEFRDRLRCLQWKIDTVRERAANPLAATIAISEMMWKSFTELGEKYQDLAKVLEGNAPERPNRTATVLPFNRAAFARS